MSEAHHYEFELVFAHEEFFIECDSHGRMFECEEATGLEGRDWAVFVPAASLRELPESVDYTVWKDGDILSEGRWRIDAERPHPFPSCATEPGATCVGDSLSISLRD